MRIRTHRAHCSRAIADRYFVRTVAAVSVVGAMLVIPTAARSDSPKPAKNRPAKVSVVVDPFGAFVAEAAQRSHIPVSWIRAIMRAESREDAHATSPKGAMGLMQIMPSTWAELRAKYRLGPNPYDPHDNILAGAAFLRELYDHYGSPGFLAAYNAGPGRYENHLATGRTLPAETQGYVAEIAPTIGEGRPDDAINVASAAHSWTQAPLFIEQDESKTAVEQAPLPLRPNLPSNDRRIVDVTALAPRSDNLFVQILERERAR